MDSYDKVIKWLYEQLPVYQNTGGEKYKIDLKKSISFMEILGNPHLRFPSFHIAGTNGKGSTSHMIASILQAEGYKVGLYTSPHLLDFRERIRINGKLISKKQVVDFIKQHKAKIKHLELSFFELTVGLAFSAFETNDIDIAVVEVGMGGRLDSTNVLSPLVSAITNIDLDHMKFLGNTRKNIALEKSGIIKKGVPVVIGQKDKETEDVFINMARKTESEIFWSEDDTQTVYKMDLLGDYQIKNQKLALSVLKAQDKFHCHDSSITKGLKNISKSTGILGRWQIIHQDPYVVLDTAHNGHGMHATMTQWKRILLKKSRGFMILGVVNDKDLSSFWQNIPKDSHLYLTKPNVERGLNVDAFISSAIEHGYTATANESFSDAIHMVRNEILSNDALYIGGSTFLVADALRMHTIKNLF